MIGGYDAIDLFAGPGGWDVAARNLGLEVTGVENDSAAVATRVANKLGTIVSDVRNVDPLMWDTPGLIASPPCQTFSQAGKGAGRKALDVVLEGVRDVALGMPIDYGRFDDVRTGLVLEPLRWAIARLNAGNPFQWIALEQVPGVLPVWEAYAGVLRDAGYSVVTSVVSAEQYGVPQTRKRAVLLAHRARDVKLPTATHRKYRKGVAQHEVKTLDEFDLKPWVSMADALGWGMTERPCITLAATSTSGGPRPLDGGSGARRTIRTEREAGRWLCPTNVRPNSTVRHESEPAGTLAFGHEKPRWLVGGQGRNSGPGAAREPRPLDAPSYTIRANGSGSHPSGTEWMVAAGVAGEGRPRASTDPAPTITTRRTAAWVDTPEAYRGGTGKNATERVLSEPAPTVHFGERLNKVTWQPSSVQVTPEEAAILQSFPADYKWQGSRTKQFQQIGNAIPPVLAEALLREVAA